jgi:hypothetical protein
MLSLKTPDPKFTEGVREAIEQVDREVARLAAHASAEDAAGLGDFRRAWGRLVDLLVLGPPERLKCPFCGTVREADSTWCRRCRETFAPTAGSVT